MSVVSVFDRLCENDPRNWIIGFTRICGPIINPYQSVVVVVLHRTCFTRGEMHSLDLIAFTIVLVAMGAVAGELVGGACGVAVGCVSKPGSNAVTIGIVFELLVILARK